MQLLIFILIFPLLWIVSILPHRIFYGVSDIVFFLVYHVFGYRKKIVLSNLKLTFPDKTDTEHKEIRIKFYKHMCDMFMEMVKTMNMSKEDVKKRYNVVNIELLKEIEKEKSVLIVCSHYANWEWNVSINNYVTSKGYAVYQKIGNKYFDQWIKKVRSRWNTTPILQKDTVKTVLNNERNHIRSAYGMVSDQSPPYSRAQYWSNFMGLNVPVFNGAEVLAKKLDLAVVFLKVTKAKRGYYKAEFIPITQSGKNTEKNAITDQFLKLTEDQIRAQPEYYLWTHRRWKHAGKKPKHNKG